jgi:hypothetical protein
MPDDKGETAGDPDAARLGHLGAAGGRRHPRMRGARLDAGSRRPACSRARVCTENPKSDHSGDEVRPGWRAN